MNEGKKLTGILLAAGMGKRLGEITKDKPKALVSVNDKPLFSYAIDFLRGIGAEKIIVVGGFQFDDLKNAAIKYDGKITIARNDNFTKGNMFSLEAALEYVDGSFLMCNTDHIYKLPIREKVKSQLDGITAFCDFDRILGDDDMKVMHSDFGLKEISKKLISFNAGYVGMTYCGEEKLPVYKECLKKAREKYGEQAVVENILAELSLCGERVNIGDISGHGWLEIDMPEELRRAEEAIKMNTKDYVL